MTVGTDLETSTDPATHQLATVQIPRHSAAVETYSDCFPAAYFVSLVHASLAQQGLLEGEAVPAHKYPVSVSTW